MNIDWLRFEKLNSTDLKLVYEEDENDKKYRYYDLNGKMLKSDEIYEGKHYVVIKQSKTKGTIVKIK